MYYILHTNSSNRIQSSSLLVVIGPVVRAQAVGLLGLVVDVAAVHEVPGDPVYVLLAPRPIGFVGAHVLVVVLNAHQPAIFVGSDFFRLRGFVGLATFLAIVATTVAVVAAAPASLLLVAGLRGFLGLESILPSGDVLSDLVLAQGLFQEAFLLRIRDWRLTVARSCRVFA